MREEDAAQSAIDPRLLFRYLANHGWRLDPAKNSIRRAWLPEDENNESLEIFVSENSKRHRDVYFAINTLSQLYDKTTDSLINEIRSLPYDIITSKIPSEYVRNDSIELRIAASYIDKMKDFLASSATTELSGSRAYKRVVKEAVEYSESCRFGHTFKGSFGFQIESPVGLNDEPTSFGVEQLAPFERRVIERVARGFSSLESASEHQDPSIIVAESHGFSANMCDSIADIIESIEVSEIEFGIAFSPEWINTANVSKKGYTVGYQQVEILRNASSAMRINEPSRVTHIVGRIKKLQAEGNPSDLLEDKSKRQIDVAWVNEDSQLVNVKVLLPPQDYLSAVEAHKAGASILATGMLSKNGRSWQLTEVTSFIVVDGKPLSE
jgi:hypothetical protein